MKSRPPRSRRSTSKDRILSMATISSWSRIRAASDRYSVVNDIADHLLKVDENLRALVIEPERHLPEPLGGQRTAHRGLGATGAIEHQEAAATGADHLSPQGAVRA